MQLLEQAQSRTGGLDGLGTAARGFEVDAVFVETKCVFVGVVRDVLVLFGQHGEKFAGLCPLRLGRQEATRLLDQVRQVLVDQCLGVAELVRVRVILRQLGQNLDRLAIDFFGGARLATNLIDDLLRGWGAAPELHRAATALVDDLAAEGPLAPPVDIT